MQRNGVMECTACRSRLVAPSPRSVSRAYDKHHNKITSKFRALKFLLVVGDCMLVGLQPILVFMSKVDGKFQFSPISVNFLTEVAKVIFAIVMLVIQSRKQKAGEKPLLARSTLIQAARNNVLLAVPALLYAINNYLKFIMQLYFNPSTVKMLSNLKVHFSCPTQMSCFSCIGVYAYITPFVIQTSLGTGHSCSSEIYNEKEVLCYSVGSSCSITYWDQHQSTSNCTCGRYGIRSSYHCYRIHLYTDFCNCSITSFCLQRVCNEKSRY
uniref:Uncharacterized protein n=1 Tax=Aegilops tauschii subsp. strangulata TaxID=200361 RepID=A0A453P108_AEGTS